MLFHLCRTDFEKFIQNISIRANIDIDIIEKDYYVYLILKELAQKQDYLKAYFNKNKDNDNEENKDETKDENK